MLTLTRAPGSVLFVDGPAAIVFHEWKGAKIRLSIDAPHETVILRGETLPDDEERDALHQRNEVRNDVRRAAFELVEQITRAPDDTTGAWGPLARAIVAMMPREERR